MPWQCWAALAPEALTHSRSPGHTVSPSAPEQLATAELAQPRTSRQLRRGSPAEEGP